MICLDDSEIHATLDEETRCQFKCCRDEIPIYAVEATPLGIASTKNFLNDGYLRPNTKVPATVLIVKTVNDKTSLRLLKVLFDGGSDATLINQRCLPKNVKLNPLSDAIQNRTILGSMGTHSYVNLKGLTLPEFDSNKQVPSHQALVFDADIRYDLIMGRDFLEKIGIRCNHDTKEICWFDRCLPMKTHQEMDGSFHHDAILEDDDLNLETHILDAKYEMVDAHKIASKQNHLTQKQRTELAQLFTKYHELFNGTLGRYPHRRVHLELLPNAIPIHSRPYSVPKSQEEVFRKELEHLVRIGVLRRCGATEWGSPTFIVPKKDGRVRWVSDFRALNKVIRRRVYPLPRIQEILTRDRAMNFSQNSI